MQVGFLLQPPLHSLQHLSDVVGSFLTLPIISKDKVIGVTQVLKRDAFSASVCLSFLHANEGFFKGWRWTG